MVSFFLPMHLQVQVTGVVCLYFVIRVFFTKQHVPPGNYLWALFFGSIFLMYLFSVPFTPPEYKKTLLHLCENRVSLLFMPLVFAIISPKFRATLMGELMYFVYGCVITCIAANTDFAYHYFFLKEGAHTLSHVAYRTITYLFTQIHPTYMSMYLCFSICILLLSSNLNIRVHPFVINTLLFLSFVFLLALGAKTPIIALGLIIIHYAWVNRSRLYKYRTMFIGLLATIVAAWYFIPFLRQRVYEIVQFFGTEKQDSIANNSVYIRKVIWNMDSDLLKHYWLTGAGPGRLYFVVHLQSFFYSLNYSLHEIYHDPHSEYLYEWLCFGVLGVAILIATICVHFRQAIRFKDHLYLYLLIILCTTFFTESVLSLQRGVVFYAVFTSLMFYSAKE